MSEIKSAQVVIENRSEFWSFLGIGTCILLSGVGTALCCSGMGLGVDGCDSICPEGIRARTLWSCECAQKCDEPVAGSD